MDEQFTITPTIIRQLCEDGVTGVVSVPAGEAEGDRALLVFTSPAQAEEFIASTGLYTGEGFEAARVDHRDIAHILRGYGFQYVVMSSAPHWDGEGGSNLFTGEGFVRLLLGEFNWQDRQDR